MTREIDVMHLGRERVICAYEVDGLVVDPGPASCLDTLLAGLESEPRALLLTHIHLDHAGAAGAIARSHPQLRVYVHDRGAPHLADPTKLLESSARLYGDEMERLWGEVAPVPAERITALSGGEVVEGMRVAYTPGHASHHVSYLREDTGEAFVGDVAGMRLPGSPYTVAPTPPPEVDVEAWLSSLETVEEWGAAALCLTHFGRHVDAWDQLQRARESLRTRSEKAREAKPEEFAAWAEAELRAAVDAATADSLMQAAPSLEQLGHGLRRYWENAAQSPREADA